MTTGGKGPDLDAAGTTEAAWLAWLGQPPVELSIGPVRHAVIVAPHPDDEVLAAGGLVQHLAGRGVKICIVGVTDGEGSHPRSPTTGPRALAHRRFLERRRALEILGASPCEVLALGLPDGSVADHPGELESCLRRLLGPDVLCVAPWEHDGHPDHDATGRVAAAACAAAHAPFLNSLVWTWHWARPDGDDVPWERARRLPLTRRQATRKRWATQAFRSQIAPLSAHPGDEAILDPEMLAHFDRPFEVFLA